MKKLFSVGLVIQIFSALSWGATIHIQSSAEVSNSRLTLGDIATIVASSPHEEAALGALSIGTISADETMVILTASQISEKLRTHMDELKNVQLIIPEKIEVRRKDQNISSSRVKDQIEKIVRAQLPDPSWEYEVSEVSLAPVISQIKAAGFQVIPPLARPKGVFSFELLTTEHAVPRRFWVTAKVQYFCSVGLLNRQINAHSRFLPSDIQWQKKEVTFLNETPATATDAAIGLARINLSPGTVLLRSHLEREMALKFGDQVDLVLGDDGMAIMTKGIAQQNGFVGDTVKVKSLATDKVLDGIITARGVVNVRY